MPLQQRQAMKLGALNVVRLNPKTALRLGLKDGARMTVKQNEAELALPVVCDDRIALDALWIPGGGEVILGDLMGEIEAVS